MTESYTSSARHRARSTGTRKCHGQERVWAALYETLYDITHEYVFYVPGSLGIMSWCDERGL